MYFNVVLLFLNENVLWLEWTNNENSRKKANKLQKYIWSAEKYAFEAWINNEEKKIM